MVRKLNTFEGGVDGSTVTAGNSGGDSGDTFSTIYVGGGTFVYSATNPLRGLLSGLLSMVSGLAYTVEWTGFNPGLTSASKSRMGHRWLIRTPATLATVVTDIVQFRSAVTGKPATLKWVSSSGIKLGVFDLSSDTTARALTAATFTPATEYEIGFFAVSGSTTDGAGGIKAAIYPKGSDTPIEVIALGAVPGAAAGSTANVGTSPLTFMRFGKLNPSTQVGDLGIDSVQGSDEATDLLPVLAAGNPTIALSAGKRYTVDAAGSAAGAGGALTFSAVKKSGPDLAVVQRGSLFLFTASTTTDAVYTVTVSEAGGGSTAQDVVIPADLPTSAAVGYTELVTLGAGNVWG